jgi:hypothetical protein
LALAVGCADLAYFVLNDGWANLMRFGFDANLEIILLLGAVSFSTGTGLLAWGFVQIHRAHASARWPTTRGTVLASDIKPWELRSGVTYEPRVRYEYVILGARYESDTIEFSQRSFNELAEADQVVSAYPVRGHVDVHYDPDDPRQSCLQPLDVSAWRSLRGALWFLASPLVLLLLLKVVTHFRGY